MRKPPSKVCIGNFETVLDVIHFVGMGMGEQSPKDILTLLFHGIRKVFELSFEEAFSISWKTRNI